MTKFHTDGETLLSTDPFESVPDFRLSSQPTGRIVFKEDKYPKGRAIAAAFWISYFTLHWLDILGVVGPSSVISTTIAYFMLSAVIATVVAAISEEAAKVKK